MPLSFGLSHKAYKHLKSLSVKDSEPGFREFLILADKLINQDSKNIFTLIELLSQNAKNDVRVLELFFKMLYEMFSDQYIGFKPSFKSLYLNFSQRKSKFTAKDLTEFIDSNFPLIEKLLCSFFTSRFFGKKPSHSLFSPKTICYRSFLSISECFSLYLTNNQYCFGKGVKTYLIYTAPHKSITDPDELSKLNSHSRSHCQFSLLHFRTDNFRGSASQIF